MQSRDTSYQSDLISRALQNARRMIIERQMGPIGTWQWVHGTYVPLLGFQPQSSTLNTISNNRMSFFNLVNSIDHTGDNAQNQVAEPLLSQSLDEYVRNRKAAKTSNAVLSDHYNVNDYLSLKCPISLDFPVIPVRFNGRLYDYECLMGMLTPDGFIQDPFTREKIKITAHVIQADFSAQAELDRLLEQKPKNNIRPT